MYKIEKVKDYYELVNRYDNMIVHVNLTCSSRVELKNKIKEIAQDLGFIIK